MKMTRKQTWPKLRFDDANLSSQDLSGTFKVTIGGKVEPLINLRDNGMDKGSMISTYNTTLINTDSDKL